MENKNEIIVEQIFETGGGCDPLHWGWTKIYRGTDGNLYKKYANPENPNPTEFVKINEEEYIKLKGGK